jgi:hypothetical protein
LYIKVAMKENTINYSNFKSEPAPSEALSDYVAHLQMHMALQARNLVPHLGSDRYSSDSRSQLLQQTQVTFEKLASRQ